MMPGRWNKPKKQGGQQTLNYKNKTKTYKIIKEGRAR
jgi:hypothetical protein